jgi:hypothetical protein
MPKLNIIRGKNAIRADLNNIGIFSRLISSSRDPSNTIRIKPIVPNKGSTELKFGILKFSPPATYLIENPSTSNKITVGIFDLLAVKSKIYANIINKLMLIIIDVVIQII